MEEGFPSKLPGWVMMTDSGGGGSPRSLDTAAARVLRFAAPLRNWGMHGGQSRGCSLTVSRALKRLGVDHLCSAVSRRRVHSCSSNTCAGCGEGDRSGSTAGRFFSAACLTQASASSLPAIPWCPGIHSRVVMLTHLSATHIL